MRRSQPPLLSPPCQCSPIGVAIPSAQADALRAYAVHTCVMLRMHMLPCICCPCIAQHTLMPTHKHSSQRLSAWPSPHQIWPLPDLALARPGPRQTWPSPGLIKVYTLIQALLTCTSAVGGAAAPSSFSELDELLRLR